MVLAGHHYVARVAGGARSRLPGIRSDIEPAYAVDSRILLVRPADICYIACDTDRTKRLE
jgi:hypothetical protein